MVNNKYEHLVSCLSSKHCTSLYSRVSNRKFMFSLNTILLSMIGNYISVIKAVSILLTYILHAWKGSKYANGDKQYKS